MGRKSSLKDCPPDVLAELHEAIREDRLTIDQLKEFLAEHGVNKSRAAIGRYRKTWREGMEVYAQSQEMAKVWGKSMEDNPESDVAKLARGVLGSVALNTAQSMINSGEAMPAGEVMFLAKALDHIAKADMSDTQRILRIRQEAERSAAKKAAAVVEKSAKANGVSPETIKAIRRDLLGMAN